MQAAALLWSAWSLGLLLPPSPPRGGETTPDLDSPSATERAETPPPVVLGGRLMSDWTFASSDDGFSPGVESGVDFRRLRLVARGTLEGGLTHRVEVEFAGSEVELADAYLALEAGGGSVRVGRFWEPFGLEQLTDPAALTFLERAPSFAPGRNHGIEYSGHAEEGRATWAVGVFKETDDDASEDEDSWNVSARGTLLPFDDGPNLLHLGLALSRQGRPRTYEARPGSQFDAALESPLVGEDDFAGPLLVGFEVAGVLGAWSAQAEAQLATAETGNAVAAYAYASRFLTAQDSRRYDRSRGAFHTVTPAAPRGGGGSGAVEVALRVDHIDFSEVPGGGVMTNLTAGVSWYLTARSRVMLGYTDSRVDANNDGSSQGAELLALRFQVDF